MHAATAPTVLVHPESRLVAPGVQVVFRCVLNNTEQPHWVVNNYIALSPNQKSFLLSKGYMIDEITDGSVTTLQVKVTATGDKNNSDVFCSSIRSDISSKRARLLIINGVLYNLLLRYCNGANSGQFNRKSLHVCIRKLHDVKTVRLLVDP